MPTTLPAIARPLARALTSRLRRRRRAWAAACAAAAALLAWQAARPAEPSTAALWVAARDLQPGMILEPGDLTRVHYPRAAAPHSPPRRSDLLGRALIAPVASGQPLSGGAVLGPGPLAGRPGKAAVGVRISDAGLAGLLSPGDSVDLVAVRPGADRPEALAEGAVVLGAAEPGAGLGAETGRLVLFAVGAEEAETAAAAAAFGFVSVIWNG